MFYPLGSDIPSRNLYYFTSDQVYTWVEEQKEMGEPKDQGPVHTGNKKKRKGLNQL
ncbi:hypothetical protein J6590_096963, partial [Homalodisca vitripennis]